MPLAVVAMISFSIVARISAPTDSSVMPSEWSIFSWPSAVAPPWLPIAGTTNGSAPRSRSPPIAPRVSSTRLLSPRLPAPTATVMPGVTAGPSRSTTAARAVASTSATGVGDGTSSSTSCSVGIVIRGSNGKSTPRWTWSHPTASSLSARRQSTTSSRQSTTRNEVTATRSSRSAACRPVRRPPPRRVVDTPFERRRRRQQDPRVDRARRRPDLEVGQIDAVDVQSPPTTMPPSSFCVDPVWLLSKVTRPSGAQTRPWIDDFDVPGDAGSGSQERGCVRRRAGRQGLDADHVLPLLPREHLEPAVALDPEPAVAVEVPGRTGTEGGVCVSRRHARAVRDFGAGASGSGRPTHTALLWMTSSLLKSRR